MSGAAATIGAQARQLGLSVSFVNVAMDSATASRLLLDLGAQGQTRGSPSARQTSPAAASNRSAWSLQDAVRRFAGLLDRM